MSEQNQIKPARKGDTEQDMKKLGLKSKVEPWEDGIRSDPDVGSFEWWYFDANLEDGSQLVIQFYTKDVFATVAGLQPQVTLSLVRPDKTIAKEVIYADVADSSFSTKEPLVRIGTSYFKGDLDKYEVHIDGKDADYVLELTSTVPAWRDKTSYVYFGEHDEDYFAWLPAVPRGMVSLTINPKNGDEAKVLSGVGYHDHNWGSTNMLKLLHHWYWGRANIGPYTVISSYTVANAKYGYKSFKSLFLANDHQVISLDSSKVDFKETDVVNDPQTGKPFGKEIQFETTDSTSYRITYIQKNTILQEKMINHLSGKMLEIAEQNHFDGAYLRFTGTVRLEVIEDGKVIEQYEQPALWEEMYPGANLK